MSFKHGKADIFPGISCTRLRIDRISTTEEFLKTFGRNGNNFPFWLRSIFAKMMYKVLCFSPHIFSTIQIFCRFAMSFIFIRQAFFPFSFLTLIKSTYIQFFLFEEECYVIIIMEHTWTSLSTFSTQSRLVRSFFHSAPSSGMTKYM